MNVALPLLKRLDRAFGPAACGLTRWMAGRRAPTPPRGTAWRRVLVLRPGGLGDMVLLLPVLTALRRAGGTACTIDVVCERRNSGLVRALGLADRVLEYDRTPLRLLAALWRGRYDVCLDSEQFHHFSAVWSGCSGAGVRVGFDVTPARRGLYTHRVPYVLDAYEGSLFARLVEPLGLDPATVPPVWRLLADTPLALPAAAPARSDAPRTVFVCPGSTTPYKHWGAPAYTELVRRLASGLGARVVLVGGSGDRADAVRVAAASDLPTHALTDLTGRLTLPETAALLRTGAVFCGSDSGLAHLATAVGTPAVVLFGPSDLRKWAAPVPGVTPLTRPQPCSPCFRFGERRPCATFACVRSVPVEDVVRAVARYLAAPASVRP